jgi:hypothetical protein
MDSRMMPIRVPARDPADAPVETLERAVGFCG